MTTTASVYMKFSEHLRFPHTQPTILGFMLDELTLNVMCVCSVITDTGMTMWRTSGHLTVLVELVITMWYFQWVTYAMLILDVTVCFTLVQTNSVSLDIPINSRLVVQFVVKVKPTKVNVDYRVAQNKIPHQTICNISPTSGQILKFLEAA